MASTSERRVTAPASVDTDAEPPAPPGTERIRHRGPDANWPETVGRRMETGQPLLLVGFPLTDVAHLCLARNYRWSFAPGADRSNGLHLMVTPAPPKPSTPKPAGPPAH